MVKSIVVGAAQCGARSYFYFCLPSSEARAANSEKKKKKASFHAIDFKHYRQKSLYALRSSKHLRPLTHPAVSDTLTGASKQTLPFFPFASALRM